MLLAVAVAAPLLLRACGFCAFLRRCRRVCCCWRCACCFCAVCRHFLLRRCWPSCVRRLGAFCSCCLRCLCCACSWLLQVLLPLRCFHCCSCCCASHGFSKAAACLAHVFAVALSWLLPPLVLPREPWLLLLLLVCTCVVSRAWSLLTCVAVWAQAFRLCLLPAFALAFDRQQTCWW